MLKPSAPPQRCLWAQGDPLMEAYHDEEWGRPEYGSRALFEKLLLDGLQAGLSWRTILYRRAGLRVVLDRFNPKAMAHYDEARIAALLADSRMIRNRLKTAALVNNAQAYLALHASNQNFAPWLWRFVNDTPQQHHRPHGQLAPTQSEPSVAMSKALRAQGFTFVGPTICYAFMQAVGMVNDHDVLCPQYKLLGGTGSTKAR